MSREIRTLGKHTLIYGAGVAVGRLASFIMLPIYTRLLTTADYGVLELLTMTIDVIGTIAGVGLASAVFKFYAEQRDETGRKEVIGTAQLALVSLALLTAGAGVLAAPALSDLVLGEDGRPLYFRLFFLIYFFNTLETIPLLYLRALNRSVLFVSLNVARLVAMLGLNIYFVVVEGMGVLGVLYSLLIASGAMATFLTIYLYRHIGFHFSAARLRTLVRFGAPMVLWFLGNFVLVFSDRYFLKAYADSAAVGIYSLAYRFAILVTALGFRPFQMVWGPQRFQIARTPDAGAIFPRVFTYLNIALGSLALLIALFVDEVIVVMADAAFHPAAGLVPILLAAQIVYHWVAFCNLGLYLRERTGILGSLSAVAATVVVGLNFYLVPRYGVYGAAWATLAAYSIRFVAIYILAQREYRIAYRWSKVARLYLLFGAALAAQWLIGVPSLPLSLVVSAALAVFCLLAVYGLVLSVSERDFARRLVAHPVAALRKIR